MWYARVYISVIIMIIHIIFFSYRFDGNSNGYLTLEDFIKGWDGVADTPGGAVMVDRMKVLTAKDSVLL